MNSKKINGKVNDGWFNIREAEDYKKYITRSKNKKGLKFFSR